MTERFRLADPLPDGLLVLEASAGTGKTWSLEGIAVRSIAERGLRSSQLCIVSFTRLATADLRARVRRRLAGAAAFLDSDDGASSDELHQVLIDGIDSAERTRRARAVHNALAEFDSASITTIHGFCTRVLASGGADASLPISEDDDDVIELVDDAIVAEIAAHRHDPGWVTPSRSKLLDAVRLRLKLPDARIFTLEPRGDDWIGADGKPVKFSSGQLDLAVNIRSFVDLVERLVAQVHERRRSLRIRTNDSLLTDARELLRSPKGPGVVAALRSAFALVLIDEFQDTDRVQWEIFRTAFLDEIPGVGEVARPALVVVGDPKQSIYRFRSAELSAYLDARAVAEQQGAVRSLDTNHRSDPAVLDALEHLFADFTFGDDSIVFHRVAARPGAARRAIDCDDEVALQLRDVSGASDMMAWAVDDCVAEVIRLLERATLDTATGSRRVEPRDIGIIVSANDDADLLARALESAGVPASSSSNSSVLDSDAASEIGTFLLALERPASLGRLRAAALGWFVGDDHHALAARNDEQIGELADRFRAWALALSTRGLPGLVTELRREGLAARLLAQPQGDRDLTDLDHIFELLQGVTHGARLTPTALLEAFTRLRSTAGSGDDGVASELLARRVDRDDQTVSIVTIHKSKGLEFPIVLCPTLFKQRRPRKGLNHAEIDVRGERRRTISSAKLVKETSAAAFDVVAKADEREYFGEDRRLLYVALTRAKHRVVIWWNPKVDRSALRELLDHASAEGTVDELVATSKGTIAVVPVTSRPSGQTWNRPVIDPGPLEVARAARRFERTWRVWSFSFIKSESERLAEQRDVVVDLIEHSSGNDEPTAEAGDVVASTVELGPLQDAPRGASFGTLVHSLFEHLDFASENLDTELRDACARALQYRRLPTTPDRLAAGLAEALSAPLGGRLGSSRLRDLERIDRLDELVFDLPLSHFEATRIADVLLRHLDADDPMRPWAQRVASGELEVEIEGMLTGSVDLVARSEVDGERRYWLADYKTNYRADGDYSAVALVDTMAHSGYPLQATIYSVALHRYLRWRLSGYDPERHLLGSAYLFVRGMRPDNDPTTHVGVHWWRVPTPALFELDELFARGEP